VIAHDALRRPGLDHVPHEFDRSHLSRPPVDQIADEDRDAPGTTPNAARLAIAEICEQRHQLVALPMDVADDIQSG
jgi:hypothetical protein